MSEKLQLSTGKTPDIVEIDGQPYELLAYDEMTMLQSTQLRRLTVRHSELAQLGDSRTDEQCAEMDRIVDETCERVLPGAPRDVVAKLNRKMKSQLSTFFFQRIAIAHANKTQAQSSSSQPSSAGHPGSG